MILLPFTALRRLVCVLQLSRQAVLAEKTLRESQGLNQMPFLLRVAGLNFCNISPLCHKALMGVQENIAENLRANVQGFSPEVRDIFESLEFQLQLDRLEKAGLPYQTAERFGQIDLHPQTVSNAEMGLVFEQLSRKFAELSNETAGEHFTSREVINPAYVQPSAAALGKRLEAAGWRLEPRLCVHREWLALLPAGLRQRGEALLRPLAARSSSGDLEEAGVHGGS